MIPPRRRSFVCWTLPPATLDDARVEAISRETRFDAAYKKQRNLADYTGARLEARLVDSCIEAAGELLADVTSWLEGNKPELLQD